MTVPQQIITVGLCVLSTMLTRFLPFFIFRENQETPAFIRYIGKFLPSAVFGMLVIYCLKNVSFLSGKERVIDAYCGIGTIGLIAARKAKEVIGVELNGDAVRDAVRNAKMNAVENARFYENDAGIFMTEMAAAGEHADVVFMDPPRAGSDEAFLSSIVTLAPKKVVYISCNPQTQARDLAYLRKHGYQAEGCWPYDLFPMTEHVETVVLMSRVQK